MLLILHVHLFSSYLIEFIKLTLEAFFLNLFFPNKGKGQNPPLLPISKHEAHFVDN